MFIVLGPITSEIFNHRNRSVPIGQGTNLFSFKRSQNNDPLFWLYKTLHDCCYRLFKRQGRGFGIFFTRKKYFHKPLQCADATGGQGLKPWPKRSASSHMWTKVALAQRLAFGDQTDSQVSSKVQTSSKKHILRQIILYFIG